MPFNRRGVFFGIGSIVLVSLTSAFLTPTALAVDDPSDVSTILARMRTAAGTDALATKSGDFVLKGKSIQSGSPGEFELRFTSDGRFLWKVIALLGETRGFNGSVCWRIDRSGVFRTLEMFEQDFSR